MAKAKTKALERAELMVQKHRQAAKVADEKEKLDKVRSDLARLNRRN